MTPLDRYRWASGRRRYNRLRKLQMECRRLRVWADIYPLLMHRGSQAAMARALGVSRWTIYRDVAAFHKWMRQRLGAQQG